MGFFDFLKPRTTTEKKDETKQRNSPQIRSFSNIDELLNFDFSNLPDDTYKVTDVTDNGYGDTIRNYQSNEKQNIYGLFDYVEIKKFIGKPNKNFILVGENIKNYQKLKDLTNDLVQLYGNDHIKKGKFSYEDERDIKNGYWTGRSWLDGDKYKTPIMLSYDNIEGVSMTVFKTE